MQQLDGDSDRHDGGGTAKRTIPTDNSFLHVRSHDDTRAVGGVIILVHVVWPPRAPPTHSSGNRAASLAMQADNFMYPSMGDREPQPLNTQRLHKLPFRKRLLKRDKTKFMKYVSSTTTHGVRRIFIGKSKIRRVM